MLGIETSCDETAAAVVRGRRICSNVVASQIALHHRFGGVVPELASRRHLETILRVVRQALEEAGVGVDQLDGLAVTQGPGLVGSLLVGLSFAKGMALASGLPLVGVDHLEGHVFAFALEREPRFPFVALLASGGHTALWWVEDLGRWQLLGSTRDDAAGEAFDKVSKLLGLGYPGGPLLERLAREGNPRAIRLPRPLPGEELEFSFSGLKTAVAQLLRGHPSARERHRADIAASFQEAVVEVLVQRLVQAVERTGARVAVLCGGVAANRRLRAEASARLEGRGVELVIPSPALCTDNAAMIALVGGWRLARGERSGLDIAAYSRRPPQVPSCQEDR